MKKRPFIVIDRRWGIFAALVAGAAFGTALAHQMRRVRHVRRADERRAATVLHEWEGEGGSLGPAVDSRTGQVDDDRRATRH